MKKMLDRPDFIIYKNLSKILYIDSEMNNIQRHVDKKHIDKIV
jgi:hypothetical protein